MVLGAQAPARTGVQLSCAAAPPARTLAVPRPLLSPPTRFYRPELDMLRLVAFLMVWLAHSLPAAGDAEHHGVRGIALFLLEAVRDAGNFGVCVFFFLSAYLITELLRRERAATGTIHLRAFYIRRMLRIWPLYLGVLLLYGVVGLRFHGFAIEPGRLLCSLLLAGNWYIAFHPAILTPMRALWSLSVEEQFYLAWPLLGRVASAKDLARMCIALIAASQLTLLWLAQRGGPWLHVTAWVNSSVQFQFFALGALVAVLLRGRVPQLPSTLRFTMLGTSAAMMAVAASVCQIKRPLPSHTAAALMGGYLLVGAACVCLFGGTLGASGRFLVAPLVRLGQISFGLYVFHETGFFFTDALERLLLRRSHTLEASPLLEAHWAMALCANKLAALTFTVLLASLSYRYWERPFLRWKDRFTSIQTRPA